MIGPPSVRGYMTSSCPHDFEQALGRLERVVEIEVERPRERFLRSSEDPRTCGDVSAPFLSFSRTSLILSKLSIEPRESLVSILLTRKLVVKRTVASPDLQSFGW